MTRKDLEASPIAALYVQTDGCYFGLDGVDPWDEPRDARKYAGPHPVVAHPPCRRWGRYWYGGPSCKDRKLLGDDAGCFAQALWAVRTFGGVLEHPETSKAWDWYGLLKPLRGGGWSRADAYGWTCCVEQGHYGHRARKATWLYLVGATPPVLRWGTSQPLDARQMDQGFTAPRSGGCLCVRLKICPRSGGRGAIAGSQGEREKGLSCTAGRSAWAEGSDLLLRIHSETCSSLWPGA